MLNKTLSKKLHELLESEGIRAKKSLKDFLYWNEHDPKHKAGECFRVTDFGHNVRFGNKYFPVQNFKGKIVNVSCYKGILLGGCNTYKYELECVCNYGDLTFTTNVYADEGDLQIKEDDNINDLNGVPYRTY